MMHSLRTLALLLCAAAPLASAAQVPPQAQALLSLKLAAARDVNALLAPDQRTRVAGIAAQTEGQLAAAFGNVQAADGPIAAIFTAEQRAALARAASSRQLPALNLSEQQTARLADYMRAVVLGAAPIWQAQSARVNAVLTVAQRQRVNALRRATLTKLPQLPLPVDLFGGLGTGDVIGGFASDPGSFVLLVSLPDPRSR